MTDIQSKPGARGVTLPITVEELTPQWLGDALSVEHPGTEVAAIDVVEIIWGTATKVRIEVTYTSRGADDLPTRLCVKGGFDERVRAATGGFGDAGMRSEGQFFRDLAGRVDALLPRHWFADANELQGLVIFDDLAHEGDEFGDPSRPWSPALVARALTQLARLHAGSWQRPYPDTEWLTLGAQPVRAAANHLFSAAHWDPYFAAEGAPALPEALRDRERNLRGYRALWALDDAAQTCLTHGDAHLGNTYVDTDGQPYFLDWASVARCPWSYDVAYFIVGGLDVQDRRDHERQLLEGYLDDLAAHGGPRLDPDDAWLDYRRHTLHGLIWATLPAVLQSAENVEAMTERYVTAIVEHDTLGLLEV